jgi:hypothetical protein
VIGVPARMETSKLKTEPQEIALRSLESRLKEPLRYERIKLALAKV